MPPNRVRLARHLPAVSAVYVVLAVAIPAPVHAAEAEGHEHAELPESPTLTLGSAVDQALAVYPEKAALAAGVREAEAWRARGGSWLADRPSAMLRYQSDRWGSDDGLLEYEAGIELPFWGFGGRSAAQSLGEALQSEIMAASPALEWEVAGHVRMALWDIALARNDSELAAEALASSQRLAELIARRYELGDVSQGDSLLARSAVLEQQAFVLDAEAALLDAERNWRMLTGLDTRPAFDAEALSSRDDLVPEHPALLLAEAEVARAEAGVQVAEDSRRRGATLFVGTRRERPAFEPELDDSIGLTLTVPFGGGAHLETEISAAARAAADARAAREHRLRALRLAMHEAAHGLNVAHAKLEAAVERLDVAERHEVMSELAYEKGEMELVELLRVRANTLAARLEVSRSRISERRQIALFNQAVGELP